MGRIDLPGGGTAIHLGGSEETALAQRLINARHAFVIAYCKSKGWSEVAKELSFDQIMEIREQEGWKNPNLTGN